MKGGVVVEMKDGQVALMLRSFSVVALAGYMSFYLVDGSKAGHAITNILHLLIPLFEACTFFMVIF